MTRPSAPSGGCRQVDVRSVIRTGDTAGRLGGDEFAVVLPDLVDVVDRIVEETGFPAGLLVLEGTRPEQARMLADMGCVFGQGYHFHRPLETDAVVRALSPAERTSRVS